RVADGEIDQYSLEKRYVRKDGTTIWVSLTVAASRDAQKNFKYFVVIIEDIQVRKNAEQSAHLLSAIVDSSDDAIVSKDLNGVVTSWNKSAERIFGYTAQEAVGQPITLIIPADRQGEEVDILSRIRRGERVDHFETVRRRKDGTLLNVSLTISPVKDASG